MKISAKGKSCKSKEAEADRESLMRCKTSIQNRFICKSKFLGPIFKCKLQTLEWEETDVISDKPG